MCLPKIFLINFNSISSIQDLSRFFTLQHESSVVDSLSAGGGTYSTGVITSSCNFISNKTSNGEKKIPFLSFIFLTDGDANDINDYRNDYLNLNNVISSLKTTILTQTKNGEFHTLGL